MVDEIKNKVNIALAQCNPTVGNVSGNFDLVLKARDYAVNEKADLVVFSELFLSGYPPEDLVLRNSFLEEITYYFEKLVKKTEDGGPAILIGLPTIQKDKIFNSIFSFLNTEKLTLEIKFLN